MKKQNREAKRIHNTIEEKYDLVVVGGGLSGVCCSIAAARSGCKVALIQDRPVLGGNASSEVRVWALGATSHMGNNNRWAREGGIIGEIMIENMHRNKEGNPILFDALLLDKVMAEKNISLYLNTMVYELEKINDNIISFVKAFNPQNGTLYLFHADYFCDASGDGIVGYLSGASYRIGAEDREEFNEGFSPSEEYGQLLGHTIFLYTKKTNSPVKYISPDFSFKDIANIIPKLHQVTPEQYGCNYWWFEYGGNRDTVHDSESIKFELWRIVYGIWDYIKNSGNFPEAENLTLEWVGSIPGKRESRRFEGLYMLNQNDIINQTFFDDAVAYGGWAIDLHPAKGIYSSAPSCNQYHSEGIYSIPYRSYVSKDIKNLYFVGRLISASHVAFGSTRVMITSALGGQAVGTAVGLCKLKNCYPSDLLRYEYMKELQYLLNIQGQSIPHIPINNNRNLLKNAIIKASSSLKLSGLSFDGEWRQLVYSSALLLPFRAGTKYQIEVELKSENDFEELLVDLMISEKDYNYTPNKLLESKKILLQKGKQIVKLAFEKYTDNNQYAFVIFRANENIYIKQSNERLTGILSVFNKFNKAVNNLGKQLPPTGSGFKSFEFFTPERRPYGKNIAFNITPILDDFNVENLLNGYTRPYLKSNAWIADFNDLKPVIVVEFDRVKEISGIRLYFDTDFDHPMETIQWNHPENDMPFCIKEYSIYDDRENEIYTNKNNYQSINNICFSDKLYTRSLKLVFKQNENRFPVSLFQIEIYS